MNSVKSPIHLEKQIVSSLDSRYAVRVFHLNSQRSGFCLALCASLLGVFLGLSCLAALGQAVETFPQAQPLKWDGDLSARMVEGIDRFLMRESERSVQERPKLWHRDFSSREAYARSVQPNRERLQKHIGAVEARLRVKTLEYLSDTATLPLVGETETYRVYAVRWPLFDDVYGEGLFLQPTGEVQARVIAIPDADQTPEMLVGLAAGIPAESQFARRLAENGCQVIVPVLISRDDTWSGNPLLHRFTNQPHREWIYRQAYEMGRHIIGYEVQKIAGAVDWFAEQETSTPRTRPQPAKFGVMGYGEGGLIAFYAAALDTRIDAALVSGYFGPRERLWEEPIYRNVFSLLQEFGDAELASLIGPRHLIAEYSEVPKVSGPPMPREGRSGAAPGRLVTPEFGSVE